MTFLKKKQSPKSGFQTAFPCLPIRRVCRPATHAFFTLRQMPAPRKPETACAACATHPAAAVEAVPASVAGRMLESDVSRRMIPPRGTSDTKVSALRPAAIRRACRTHPTLTAEAVPASTPAEHKRGDDVSESCKSGFQTACATAWSACVACATHPTLRAASALSVQGLFCVVLPDGGLAGPKPGPHCCPFTAQSRNAPTPVRPDRVPARRPPRVRPRLRGCR